MSDGGPSSIKRLSQCAARVPALSRGYEDRVELKFDYAVYGLVSCTRCFLLTEIFAILCLAKFLAAKVFKEMIELTKR